MPSEANAVSRSVDKLDIFVTGADGMISTAAWEPGFTGWQGWWPINDATAVPGAPVTVVSRAPDKLDVFVVGTDDRVWTAAWEPGFTSWHGWWPIGDIHVPQGSAVHAVSRSIDKLDIFVTGADGMISTAAWEPGFTSWHGWRPINDAVFLDAELTSGPLETLSGWVSMSISENGRVRYHGWVHTDGLESYDVNIGAMVRGADGVAVVSSQSGHVSGTLEGGEHRTFRWDRTESSSYVAAHFEAFKKARLELVERHRGNLGTVLVDVFDLVVKWSIGSAAEPVTLGAIVMLGETASLVMTGSLVPGARVIEGFLWLAGPDGTLFAMAAEGVAAAGSRMRDITQAEFDFVDRVFQGTLPRERILLTDTIGGRNAAFTFPRFDGKISVNMGPVHYADPSQTNPDLLVHELTHAWQIANAPIEVVWLGAAMKDLGNGNYGYDSADLGVKAWDEFGIEQQASIVEHWFRDCKPDLSSSTARQHAAYPYIALNIRANRPHAPL